MVQMPQGYWIDRTEVTQDQYQAWLATSPPLSVQDQYSCSWNLTFAPAQACLNTAPICYTECGKRPQTCVDWCDADAYCAANGKRLCGDMAGGPVAYVLYSHPNYSQWYSACTSHGLTTYPYGDGYDAEACVTTWADGQGAMPVGEMIHCQGVTPYNGVFDLSGNVGEWDDSCDFPGFPQDKCHIRGGRVYQAPEDVRCDSNRIERRDYADALTGFRCCKD
jgi:formylglycine-generating enzyme required for sulfatase activity